MSDSPDDIPRGLVFRRLGESSAGRRFALVAVAATLAAGLAFTWPLYSLVPPIEPYVLGLPFSFAWVVGWMIVVFVALVLLYRADEPSSDSE